MSIFADFVERHHPALVAEYLAAFGPPSPHPATIASFRDAVDIYIKIFLTQVELSDPEVQNAVKTARSQGLTPEEIERRMRHFCTLLRAKVETDATLDASQKMHVRRMVDHSERFLLAGFRPTWSTQGRQT